MTAKREREKEDTFPDLGLPFTCGSDSAFLFLGFVFLSLVSSLLSSLLASLVVSVVDFMFSEGSLLSSTSMEVVGSGSEGFGEGGVVSEEEGVGEVSEGVVGVVVGAVSCEGVVEVFVSAGGVVERGVIDSEEDSA